MAGRTKKPFRTWDWKCNACDAEGTLLAQHWQQAKTLAHAAHDSASGCGIEAIRVSYRKGSEGFPTETHALAVVTETASMPVQPGPMPGPFAQALTSFLNTQVSPAMGRGDVLHRCRYLIDRAIAASDVYETAKDKAAMLKAGFPYLRLYAEILGLVGPRVVVTDGESVSMIHHDRQRMMLQDPVFRDLVERMEVHAACQDARLLGGKVVSATVVDGDGWSDDPGRVRDAGVERAMEAGTTSGDPESADDDAGDG